MKSKKDITELIKENAHKLEERPSKDAWARLENRLDQHTGKRTSSIRRLFSMAASAVGLIGLGFVISFMLQNKEPHMATTNSAEMPAPNFIVEELEAPIDEEQGFYKVVEFQKTYKNRLSKPIVEGSGKKLSVSKNRRR